MFSFLVQNYCFLANLQRYCCCFGEKYTQTFRLSYKNGKKILNCKQNILFALQMERDNYFIMTK